MNQLISYIFSSKTIRHTISVCTVLVLLITSLRYAQDVTREKTATARDLLYKTYFDNPEQYDVLFLGTSHSMFGISPLEIWNDYGIASYNWSSPTCTIPSTYWKLMLLLEYNTPELVVIDCYRAKWEEKTYNEYRTHEAFDAFPLSLTKVKAISDLMYNERRKEDNETYNSKECMNILFPLSAYHSRWESINERDFINNYIDTKGSEFEKTVATPIEVSNTSEKYEITPNIQGFMYLEKIIEECQKRNIEILLTYLPYPVDETWKKEANTIADIANAYNVNYLDYTQLDVINGKTDYSDSASHLNVAGQNKVSEYLGKYIIQNYNVECHFNDKSYENWKNCYKDYRDYKDTFLTNCNEITPYLMLLQDSPNDIVIDFKEHNMLNNDLYHTLLSSLCENVTPDTDFVIIHDHKSVCLNNIRKENIMKSSSEEYKLVTDNENYTLFLNGNELYSSKKDDNSLSIQVNKGGAEFDRINYKYVTDSNGNIVSSSLSRSVVND